MEKVELQEAVRRNLQWFEESGVMEPPDGSWGVAERLSVAEGEALEKMKRAFPAWTTLPQGLVIEQRRADCNFEAALLYKLAGEVLDDPECGAVAGKILDFLYFRSGLLNRYDEGFPAGGWRWSHIQWRPTVWFDDDAWCIFIQLALAKLDPALDARYDLKKWARQLAGELVPAMRRTFMAEDRRAPGEWHDPAGAWSGRLELPHWGSLAVMALARAAQDSPDPAAAAEIRRYHGYLRENLEHFTTSEFAYAILGATSAYRVFGEAADLELARQAGELLLAKLDPETGNLPAEHYEAPTGGRLADTIYTLNWSFLALQMLDELADDPRVRQARRLQAELLVSIQDRTPDPFFRGCWRGMYDLDKREWGGGDCFEGGAGSIYTGWTNAPISIGLLFESRRESLLSLF